MILSDADIEQFMRNGDITIDPYRGSLEPASYDLRVGNKGITDDGIIDIEAAGIIRIPRGSIGVVYPMESIALSTVLAGRYGLRSSLARRGLILLSGPQVDPGFNGYLGITVFNAGTEEIVLACGDDCATIEFVHLRTPATRSYSGPYQGQSAVSSQDVQAVTGPYKNFAEVEAMLNELNASVKAANNVLNVVLLGLIAGTTGGIIILVVQALLKYLYS